MKINQRIGAIGIFLTLLLFSFSPLLIAKLMSISVFPWMQTDNDWIGFWGAYIGGCITLSGVFITILYTRKDEKNRQKLSIRPFLTVSEYDNYDRLKGILLPIGVEIDGSVDSSENNAIKVDNAIITCEMINVGLGTAINCRIHNVNIEEKTYHFESKKFPALQVNGKFYTRIQFRNININRNELSRRFSEENNRLRLISGEQGDSRILISFDIYYEDLLGNNLKQGVVFSISTTSILPISFYKPVLTFEAVGKPTCAD